MGLKGSMALIGMGKICSYLDIGKNTFYALVDEGLPVKKLAGRWTGHKTILDDYFRNRIVGDAQAAYGPKHHPHAGREAT